MKKCSACIEYRYFRVSCLCYTRWTVLQVLLVLLSDLDSVEDRVILEQCLS